MLCNVSRYWAHWFKGITPFGTRKYNQNPRKQEYIITTSLAEKMQALNLEREST